MIELKNISKNFGPVQALKKVNLTLQDGRILALVGENGAGKSTLMKILSGVYACGEYSGEITINQKKMNFESPNDSEAAGVCLIHQELSTFPHLSVAENMCVGHWPTKYGILDNQEVFKQAQLWLEKLGADFSIDCAMSLLSTGQKQLVEIAKALAKKSKYIILDEPTSSLTTKETLRLFQLLKDLKASGCGIIYISHRMEEIFQLADQVTVLRDGESVFTCDAVNTSEAELISHMVGRSLQQLFPVGKVRNFSESILELKNFKAQHKISKKEYGPLNLSVKKGEIVGFGGLLGTGRTEILQALIGDEDYVTSGEIHFAGKKISNLNSVTDSYRHKISFVSEDRKDKSILPTRSLTENVGILRLGLKNYFSFLNEKDEEKKARKDLLDLKTKFYQPAQLITELSGGNQQKVIFARAIQNDPALIILDEPTRGVDVGAKYDIYELLLAWAEKGMSILMVSSDLPELMAMSDRIFVAAKGKIQMEIPKEKFNQEIIMKAALA